MSVFQECKTCPFCVLGTFKSKEAKFRERTPGSKSEIMVTARTFSCGSEVQVWFDKKSRYAWTKNCRQLQSPRV